MRSNQTKEVAREYHLIDRTSSEWADLQDESNLAKENSSAGVTTETSFGPKRRIITRRLVRGVAANRLLDLQEEEAADGTRGHVEAIVKLMEDAAESGQPLATTIKEARQLDRLRSAKERTEEDDENKLVHQYRKEHTEEVRTSLQHVEQLLTLFRYRVSAQPPVLGTEILELRESGSSAAAGAVQDWMAGAGHGSSSFNQALDAQTAHNARLLTERTDIKAAIAAFKKQEQKESMC